MLQSVNKEVSFTFNLNMEVLFIIIFIMAYSPYQVFCINIYIFVSDLLR